MSVYAAFHNPAIPLAEAICEGGAGWMYGKHRIEMHVGGWNALVAAIKADAKRLPPIDPDKAKRYWDYAKPSAVVLSNFYEDRFDEYHAEQLAIALAPAKERGLTIAQFGFPAFWSDTDSDDAYWKIVGPYIDIVSPGYYAVDGGPAKTWTTQDRSRVKSLQLKAERYGKRLGFTVSPHTHQGNPITAQKFQAMLNLLWADDVFVWCKQENAAKPETVAAATMAAKVEMQD